MEPMAISLSMSYNDKAELRCYNKCILSTRDLIQSSTNCKN